VTLAARGTLLTSSASLKCSSEACSPDAKCVPWFSHVDICSGTTISSIVQPILDSVPAGDRAYFIVDAPSGAASYQVGVKSWDFVEDAS
jgi:hypothetical protein